MTRCRRFAMMLALLMAAASATVSAAEVWVVSPMVKVTKDMPPTASQTVSLSAARNEWESFQVVVRDDAAAITVDDVTMSDLEGPDGAMVPATAALVYAGWYHYVDNPSNCQGWEIPPCMDLPYYLREPGYHIDALIPLVDPYGDGASVAVPLDVPAGESQPFYVDVHVPLDAVHGSYSGTLTVTFADDTTATIDVELEVWDFATPVERTIVTSYGFGASLVGKFHGCGDDCGPVVDRYVEALHDHRVDVTTLKGPVTFEFDADGQLEPVDWTAYDAYMGPYLDGSKFADGAPIAGFNPGIFQPGHGLYSMTEDQYVQAAAAFLAHLQDEGWDDELYLYSSDEPWLPGHEGAFEAIVASVELLMQADPAWDGHVMVTGPMMEELQGYVDIWCPVTPMYEDWGWAYFAGREEYAEHIDQGGSLWFYVCNANFPPYAGYDLDTPLGHEPRIVKWGAWYEHAEGFLFWRANYWFSNDPWEDYANYAQFGEAMSRNGDGVLLYPGNHDGSTGTGSPASVAIDGPIVTYRLKQIRDGLEDWELFVMASDLGAEEFVRAQVEKAYTRFGTLLVEGYFDPEELPWAIEPSVLEEVRATVAAKVLYLLHPDEYPDPEAVPVVPEGTVELVEVVEPLGEIVDTPEVTSDLVPVDLGGAADGVGQGDQPPGPVADGGVVEVGTSSDTTAAVVDDGKGGGGDDSSGCTSSPRSSGVAGGLLLLACMVAVLTLLRRRERGDG